MKRPISALEHAKRLLAARERSEAQLRGALERKGYPAGEIERVIVTLKSLAFLDDRRAAEALARIALSAHQSRAAVARKLAALGVAESISEAAISQVAAEVDHHDEASARALLRARKLQGPKAARFLAGRGFDEALIRQLVPGLDDG
jgi:regulatory protein